MGWTVTTYREPHKLRYAYASGWESLSDPKSKILLCDTYVLVSFILWYTDVWVVCCKSCHLNVKMSTVNQHEVRCHVCFYKGALGSTVLAIFLTDIKILFVIWYLLYERIWQHTLFTKHYHFTPRCSTTQVRSRHRMDRGRKAEGHTGKQFPQHTT